MSAKFSILLVGGLGTLLLCLLVVSPSPPFLSLAVSIPLTRLTILTSLSVATPTLALFSFVLLEEHVVLLKVSQPRVVFSQTLKEKRQIGLLGRSKREALICQVHPLQVKDA